VKKEANVLSRCLRGQGIFTIHFYA
jgi:hypothetical protein